MVDLKVALTTNTKIIAKGIEGVTEYEYYFVVQGMSFSTHGYISKVYVTQEDYNNNGIGSGPRFIIKSLQYPYMTLGKIYKD